jgi:hypothetical protein
MRQVKRWSLLAAMLAALVALAAPGFANATTLKTKAGVVVPVGTKLTATSTNWTLGTVYGRFSCKEVQLSGAEVLISSGQVKVGPSEETSAQECEVEGVNTPVTNVKMTGLILKGGKGIIPSMSYTWHLPGATCELTATNAPVTFGTAWPTNSFKLSNIPLVGHPAACGNDTLSAEFFLTDPLGNPLFITE